LAYSVAYYPMRFIASTVLITLILPLFYLNIIRHEITSSILEQELIMSHFLTANFDMKYE
jgi:hypothetical protein